MVGGCDETQGREPGRSLGVDNQKADPLAIGAAYSEICTVREQESIFPVHHRPEFLDPPGVDDRRSVDSDKRFRIQTLFHALHCFPEEKLFPPGMDRNIITGRSDPIDLRRFKKKDST